VISGLAGGIRCGNPSPTRSSDLIEWSVTLHCFVPRGTSVFAGLVTRIFNFFCRSAVDRRREPKCLWHYRPYWCSIPYRCAGKIAAVTAKAARAREGARDTCSLQLSSP
jgi:hypothetical protein